MATIVEQAPLMPTRPTTPPPHLTLNTSFRGTPAAIPNKHIPVCSPGKAPILGLTTPPSSPPTAKSTVSKVVDSVLYPLDRFTKVLETPTVYLIEPDVVNEAIENYSSQPLPDSKLVFPWLHGLHAENAIQLSFFVARRKALRKIPPTLRGVTIVKAGGDLSRSRLKSALAPEEILSMESLRGPVHESTFIEADPREGFSVRNFQIQACKMATVSDVIVYGDENTAVDDIMLMAQRVAFAQQDFREKLEAIGWELGEFNTFVVLDSFQRFEDGYSNLVAINSQGQLSEAVHDFFISERVEMAKMTSASEIAPNVYLGPTPDPMITPPSPSDPVFDVFIEASDLAQIPDIKTLENLRAALENPSRPTVHFEVPGSGNIMPPTWSHTEVDGLLNVCRFIWDVSNGKKTLLHARNDSMDVNGLVEYQTGTVDLNGDIEMTAAPPVQAPEEPRKVLIHCPDGYTESTLLGMTYFMFAHGFTVGEAWVKLHREFGRNFFAYTTDVALLSTVQARILSESPACRNNEVALGLNIQPKPDPSWLQKHDGSLPSRVLPYMYLGNLNHANNPALLRELGIGRIVSVGEKVSWNDGPVSSPRVIEGGPHDGFEFVVVENVQDNGVDSLSSEFERCLELIEKGKEDGIATLVHCRVGVSRSATICIAEVMKEMNLSFPRAYCFVRARRLNVIIQPHLRFVYELLKWEEELCTRRQQKIRRELEWATVAREIAAMNRPYSKS